MCLIKSKEGSVAGAESKGWCRTEAEEVGDKSEVSTARSHRVCRLWLEFWLFLQLRWKAKGKFLAED